MFSRRDIAGFFVFLALTSPLAAEEQLPVFEVIEQEPYGYRDEDGRFVGYHLELANKILMQAGYKTEAKPVPVKRLIRSMTLKSTDCVLAANTPYVRKQFSVVDELDHELQIGVWPRAGVEVKSYESLQGIRIGVPAGMKFGGEFDSDETLIKVEAPTYLKGALMVEYDRIDAMMGVLESIGYAASKVKQERGVKYGEPFVMHSYKLALVCNTEVAPTPMVQKLKAAVDDMKASGEIKKIIQRYFAEID